MFRVITVLAKNNKLSGTHPMEKMIWTITPIIIIGFSKGFVLPLLNALVFILLHRKNNNPLTIVFKYSLGIVVFTSISCITFIFDFGLWYCVIIILKSISASLSLTFLALTTPLDDVLYIASKNPFLRDLCDITKCMERFLIIIEDEMHILYKAVQSRGGFNSLALKIKSTGKLGGALFINTLRRWQEIKTAIYSRGYRGKIHYLKPVYKYSAKRLTLIITYNVILVIGCFYNNG